MQHNISRIYKLAYLRGYPNLAEYIREAEAVEVDNAAIRTAATDGKRVFYNPAFFEEVDNDNHVLGIFAHEYYHIIYDHIPRGQGKHHILWNLAADVIVNEAVKRRMNFSLPKACIERGKGIFKDLPDDCQTTTQVYDWIIKNNKNPSKDESQHGQEHEEEKKEAQKKAGDAGCKKEDGEKKLAQHAENEKAHGSDEELNEVLGKEDDLEWIDLVKAMQIESGRLVKRMHKRSFLRPSRHEERGTIRPAFLKHQHVPKVDVYIDVSGSMGDNPAYIFTGLKSILSHLRIYRPRFYSFNTDIKLIDMKKEKISVGGGTDIKKVLRKIQSDKADLAIVITDCEDNIDESDFKRNVIVVSNNTTFAEYETKDWKKVRKVKQNVG